MRKLALGAVVAILLVTFGVVVYLSPAYDFKRAYDQLAIGMTSRQVEGLFEKPAEYECTYGRLRICYYERPFFYWEVRREMSGAQVPPGAEVATPEEIPYIYAAAQVAYDEHDRVVAYTQNGETTRIHTSKGTFPGSHLKDLDVEILDSL